MMLLLINQYTFDIHFFLFYSGAKWIPELLDRNTEEWQRLANEVKEEVIIAKMIACD